MLTSITVLLALSMLGSALPTELELNSRALAQVVTSCTAAKTVALTFDDGPWVYLKDVVNTLNAANAKGTFFFNGNNYDCIYNSAEADRIKYAFDAGHQVGSHTWSHAHLTGLSQSQISSEFSKTEDAIQRITGVKVAFTRPPYGEYNNDVRTVAASRGQTLVIWDFDSGDSTGSTSAQSNSAYDALINQKPSTILALNHEVYESTAHTVLPHAISELQKAGFKLVTVAECLGGKSAYQSLGSPSPRNSSWTC